MAEMTHNPLRGSLTAFCSALLDICADRVPRILLTSKTTTTVDTTADELPQAKGSAPVEGLILQ